MSEKEKIETILILFCPVVTLAPFQFKQQWVKHMNKKRTWLWLHKNYNNTHRIDINNIARNPLIEFGDAVNSWKWVNIFFKSWDTTYVSYAQMYCVYLGSIQCG